MNLPVDPAFAPMEALSVESLPVGPCWHYEPKWDGFRCLAFRDDDAVDLRSKAGKPLARYFPEVATAIGALAPRRFVLDGEIVVPVGEGFSFDDLLQRIHPAASRVKKLARERPAVFVAFDLLVDTGGASLVSTPLTERRAALERFAAASFPGHDGPVRLCPRTLDPAEAGRWLERRVVGFDGVVAKRLDLDYRSGERDGMRKVKLGRELDCVVGGYRKGASGGVGSLLLGLYDADGLLHHVGFTSAFRGSVKAMLAEKLEPLANAPAKTGEPPGFTGRAPGGPSRWSRGRDAAWVPVAPELVVEVGYDHFSQGRLRHGARFLRWRPDKAPRQCTWGQVSPLDT